MEDQLHQFHTKLTYKTVVCKILHMFFHISTVFQFNLEDTYNSEEYVSGLYISSGSNTYIEVQLFLLT